MSVMPVGKLMTVNPSSSLEIRTQRCKLVGQGLYLQADFNSRSSVVPREPAPTLPQCRVGQHHHRL